MNLAKNSKNFIPLPNLPSSISPELGTLIERIKTGYVGDGECITDDWDAAKREVVAFPSRNGADIAVKLMIALHEIGPGMEGGSIGYRPDEFCTDLAMNLIESAMRDAMAPPPAFTRTLIRHLQNYHVQLFLHTDGGLRAAFPEPGVAGRPERNDFLDNIDGAQRALYDLMCAVPGAIEAVRDAVAEALP